MLYERLIAIIQNYPDRAPKNFEFGYSQPIILLKKFTKFGFKCY
jgi:hypothetical protein